MRRALGLALALAALPASAQVPDSTAAGLEAPADTVEAPGALAAPADSLAPPVAVGPGPVGPFGLAPGRALTPVPATTAALDVASLVSAGPVGSGSTALRPAAWGVLLGAPGSTAGLALDGRLEAHALSLDGRPLLDLVTDAPRVDLLPLAAVGPVRRADGGWGRASGLSAALRPFRVGVPVTELRYVGGQDGLQHVSGTHAQTRRPPEFLRGGSGDARLTGTFHAASRAGDGLFDGADVAHTDALGRLLLTQPALALEAGALYTDRTEGARRGVIPAAGLPVAALFSDATSTVLTPGATRRTLRTEGWVRVRLPIARAAPTEAGLALAVQRLVFVPADGSLDTLRVHGRRLAAHVAQPLAVGPNRLRLRLDATVEPAPGPQGGAISADPRVGLHATATDSLTVGGLDVALGGGLHRQAGETWPSASARARLGGLGAGVRYGGRPRSWLETHGVAGRVVADPDAAGERSLEADVSVEARRGPWRLGARAFGSVTTDGRHLVSLADTAAAVVVAEGAVRQGGLGVSVGWREGARRGLYVSLDGTTRAVAGTSTDLLGRLDAALPRAWGTVRVGLRAEDVGDDDVLDLDLAAVALGWGDLRGVRVEPATGALALPTPGGDLGLDLPARATLGLEATATFSARASLFLRYDHVLGERAYRGALVTQGEPLPPHVLRFGVFWALLN